MRMGGQMLKVLLAAQLLGTPVLAANNTPAVTPKPASARGVAVLGRFEPLGGIVHVTATSTPDAVAGAVISKLHVERGTDVQAGQMLAEMETATVAKARIAETQADLETAR